ncbi:hypothetical protein PR202_gb29256 [Eleusine coracana subsp. coracana]|uniref:Uncharacterized protein n=1 Tax=Eleusine coracana subsp. coracana TaxID=191504 RepID=A0AAV5FZ77_ELECO|nr:hypothetical protein PR202_gb29256 [Eleusine coracana subsp. coracana]
MILRRLMMKSLMNRKKNVIKKDEGGARPDCMVFSVGKLKVNGIRVLCSFSIVAATVCRFLISGKVQHHHRQQGFTRLCSRPRGRTRPMSSVMGGGASTRANISFGGFYDGF